MNKEEYTKLVKSNEETYRIIELTSTINAIANILINKKICKSEELKKIKGQYEEQMINDSYEREKPENLEAVKIFNNLFGGLYKDE